MYPGEQRHQSGAFPALWQLKRRKGSPGAVGREGAQRTGPQHQRGAHCLLARPSDGASREPLSTWGRGVRALGAGFGLPRAGGI